MKELDTENAQFSDETTKYVSVLKELPEEPKPERKTPPPPPSETKQPPPPPSPSETKQPPPPPPKDAAVKVEQDEKREETVEGPRYTEEKVRFVVVC